MKREIIALFAVALCFYGGEGLAQGMGRGGGGHHMGQGAGSGSGRMYNPATVATVKGEVVSVEKVPSPKGKHQGVHALLKTESETISVRLGPDWHLKKQDVKIASGDRIEVTGSRVMIDGQPAIVAAEVKKGDQTLTLRDSKGVPAWSGWRRKQ